MWKLWWWYYINHFAETLINMSYDLSQNIFYHFLFIHTFCCLSSLKIIIFKLFRVPGWFFFFLATGNYTLLVKTNYIYLILYNLFSRFFGCQVLEHVLFMRLCVCFVCTDRWAKCNVRWIGELNFLWWNALVSVKYAYSNPWRSFPF